MPRKDFERGPMLPGMDADPRPPARPRARPAASPKRELPTARIIVLAICGVILLVVSMYAFHEIEQFVIRDTRFALNGAEGSWDSATLEIAGAAHASQNEIEAVFNDDAGRSVYLLPMNDRRTSLRAVSWVRDASIERVWPNRVVVRVKERAPVAFVLLAPSKFGLIDEDGVILPPAADRFQLPVLAGVRASDAIEERKKRVHRMQRLMHDLGDAAPRVSQVDASDPDNLKITEAWDGRVLTLLMGDHDFARRHETFLQNYPDIKRRVPNASTLDLRLATGQSGGPRITVVE